MKRAWLYVIGFMLLAMIGFGASTAMAVTAAVGPYYATPSWDQTLPASTRFIVLTNMGGAAVLDRETGLVWEQSPDGTNGYNWEGAQIHCNALTKGGRLGWRLPTIQDLASLVDQTVSPGPTLPAGHPFSNVQSDFYWSATTSTIDTSLGWYVGFNFGFTDVNGKSGSLYVWCVRGGHGVDYQ
jgi:hypothetical protein